MAERQSANLSSVPSNNNTPNDSPSQSTDDDQNKNTASADVAITAAMSKLNIGNVSLPPEDIPDCAVCLQRCIHPVMLPCKHVFCFLCVKGVAMQSGRCALCRKQITAEFFNNPTVLPDDKEVIQEEEPVRLDQYTWFYEGRNGWWQYEERTNLELEESYRKKIRTFELLIAGFVYTIDLDNMVQVRRSDPSRRRRIKRDLVSAPKKGIAGLKFVQQQPTGGDVAGANREVLGGECEKNTRVVNRSPAHRATQKTSDMGSQVTHPEEDGVSLNTEHRTSSSQDDTAYEVLQQPQVAGATGSGRSHNQNDQSSQSSSEAVARAIHSQSNNSQTNSANNVNKKKPKPKARTQIRDTVPQHPTASLSSSHVIAATNDTYGLVMHHQRGHSNPVEDTGHQSGAVSRVHPRALSHDDVDLNLMSDTTRSAHGRDGDAAETDSQSRRHVRQRRKQQHSSDV